MADAASPAAPSDAGAAAPAAAPTPAPAASSQPAPAPAWVPQAFAGDWGTEGYAEKVSAAYTDAHAKLSTRTDDLRKQVEAERRKGLPEAPDGYTFTIDDPAAGYAKILADANITLVDELPAEPHTGPGNLYALSKDPDATGWWREMCHKHGLPVEAFREGIARIAARDVRKVADAQAARTKQFADFDAAELKKLGANGAQRKEAAAKGIGDLAAKLLGDEAKGKEAAVALSEALYTAAGIEAVEQILKMTAGGLAPGVAGQGTAPRPADLMFPALAKRS